jgi:hypothetical protein
MALDPRILGMKAKDVKKLKFQEKEYWFRN